jgi:hypothetical protein
MPKARNIDYQIIKGLAIDDSAMLDESLLIFEIFLN